MKFLDALAEDRIREAERAGQFADLPGAGKPLDLDDDRLVPEEVRVAHRFYHVPASNTAVGHLILENV